MALSDDMRAAPTSREKGQCTSAAKLALLAKYIASSSIAALAHLLVFGGLICSRYLARSCLHLRLLRRGRRQLFAPLLPDLQLLRIAHHGVPPLSFGHLLSFALNLAAFKALNDHLHFYPLGAQSIAIVLVFVFNFGLNSSYSFAGRKTSRGKRERSGEM
jgi:hypothetical protein